MKRREFQSNIERQLLGKVLATAQNIAQIQVLLEHYDSIGQDEYEPMVSCMVRTREYCNQLLIALGEVQDEEEDS